MLVGHMSVSWLSIDSSTTNHPIKIFKRDTTVYLLPPPPLRGHEQIIKNGIVFE
jgi:hypothetical protein